METRTVVFCELLCVGALVLLAAGGEVTEGTSMVGVSDGVGVRVIVSVASSVFVEEGVIVGVSEGVSVGGGSLVRV
jgi:hypothetical protein